SARNGRAAFALWWGIDCKKNCAYMLEGDSTEANASILAVLCAVRDSPVNASLAIYMSSQYVIRSFCYWAGDNETRGWSCANGDSMRETVEWMSCREARVNFRWVSSKEAN
ncbi:hypothetical protein C8F04DRAFT_886534, partial [Mycena alexandri]